MTLTKLFLVALLFFRSTYLNAHQESLDMSEMLFHSTIKIEGQKDSLINGKMVPYISRGTGFFFRFAFGNDTIPTIITCYHVIRNCMSGKMVFNSRLGSKPVYGDKLAVNFENFEKLWIVYPEIDLAIIPLSPVINKIIVKYHKEPFLVTLDEINIPTQDEIKQLSAIEDVYMVGYPKGLSDTVNNIPILRKGNTATPIQLDYNKKPIFLLDIPIYTGSSGSPIFIFNNGAYTDKQGTLNMRGRFYFLGIASESQNYIAKGKVISKDKLVIFILNGSVFCIKPNTQTLTIPFPTFHLNHSYSPKIFNTFAHSKFSK